MIKVYRCQCSHWDIRVTMLTVDQDVTRRYFLRSEFNRLGRPPQSTRFFAIKLDRNQASGINLALKVVGRCHLKVKLLESGQIVSWTSRLMLSKDYKFSKPLLSCIDSVRSGVTRRVDVTSVHMVVAIILVSIRFCLS
jgi:hypothetical protein